VRDRAEAGGPESGLAGAGGLGGLATVKEPGGGQVREKHNGLHEQKSAGDQHPDNVTSRLPGDERDERGFGPGGRRTGRKYGGDWGAGHWRPVCKRCAKAIFRVILSLARGERPFRRPDSPSPPEKFAGKSPSAGPRAGGFYPATKRKGRTRGPPCAFHETATRRERPRNQPPPPAPPDPADAAFIVELVNEPAWTHFIGDRGIRTTEEARAYIATGPAARVARYGFGLGAVELKEGGTPIGICGLIKRETLPDVDLGFALLERCWRQG